MSLKGLYRQCHHEIIIGSFLEATSFIDRLSSWLAATNPRLCQESRCSIPVISGVDTYNGKKMHGAHRGMNISNKDFDVLTSHVATTLDYFKVPAQQQSDTVTM